MFKADELFFTSIPSDEQIIEELKYAFDDPHFIRPYVDTVKVYRSDTYFGEFNRDGSYVLNEDDSIKYVDPLDVGIQMEGYTKIRKLPEDGSFKSFIYGTFSTASPEKAIDLWIKHVFEAD